MFSGEGVDAFRDDRNTQIYTIIFNDGKEEMWLDHDATVNAEAASITVSGRGFQFISQFFGGGHFSGTVVKILCGGKKEVQVL